MKNVLVMAIGMLTAISCRAEKRVFAHYMVCIPTYGGNSTVADYQREIKTAQAAGIDGFALNCGRWILKEPYYRARTVKIYEAAKELNTDFKLMLSVDMNPTPDEMRDMVETFRDHPNQFKVDGKPVVSTFGGGQTRTRLVRGLFGSSIVYVPFYYPTPAAEMPTDAQVEQVFKDHAAELDGFFHFGAAGTARQVADCNHRLARKWLGAGKIFMAAISPYYRGHGGNDRVFDYEGFEGVARQWEEAIHDNVTWVELVTWNDWGESTYFAPFGSPSETEFWQGHWGRLVSHEAFLKASRYYIDWFKTGKEPAIKRDAAYYFYRLHPKAASAKTKTGWGRPDHADSLTDEVFVTAFLTAPAELEINSGERWARYRLDAGVTHRRLPFGIGTQRFILKRDGRVLADQTGEHPIVAKDTWSNFNIFSGTITE